MTFLACSRACLSARVIVSGCGTASAAERAGQAGPYRAAGCDGKPLHGMPQELGQQLKRVGVTRANDGEVAAVQCGDPASATTLG